jgi:AAA domain/UvrD-like helicase C-terminal domain
MPTTFERQATALTPTSEQQAILDAYRAGKSLVINAGAGTGKTSTLKMAAAVRPDVRGIYIAYNKAIASDAARSFPSNISCRTAHSLAFRAVGKEFQHRLNGPRQPARIVAQILGVASLRVDETLMLGATQVARIVLDTVAGFCRSADAEIGPRHVPFIEGITAPEAKARLRSAVVPLARKAWADLSRPDGRLKYQHDHYLKAWQLTGPMLEVEVVMLDEAQDANPLIADIVERQTHAQRVMVGDASQAIYGWNGAVDAMSKFDADATLYLSESFRFGPAVAEEANKWLGILGAKLRLTGRARHASVVGDVYGDPDAILCRTNAGAVSQLMAAAERGQHAALVGGGDAIKRLAQAALELQRGMPTSHPELMAFMSWGQVREYVDQESAGADLKVFVKLIDDHGADEVIATMDRLVDERYAQVVISTAHKAKGREWDRVRAASDFHEPKGKDGKPGETRPDEAMLAYVTVTRARKVLERGGLAWVDSHITPAGQQQQLALAEFDEDDGGDPVGDAHEFITQAAESAGHTEPPTREQVADLIEGRRPHTWLDDHIAHEYEITRRMGLLDDSRPAKGVAAGA